MNLVYTTCSSEKEAATIAKTLLEQKLIGCANILPSRSLYRWKGKIHDEKETVLLCKTNQKENVMKEIKKLHSYEFPIIFTIPVKDIDPKYSAWLENTLDEQ